MKKKFTFPNLFIRSRWRIKHRSLAIMLVAALFASGTVVNGQSACTTPELDPAAPADITLECGDPIPDAAVLTAISSCSPGGDTIVPVTFSEVITPNCGNSFTITRTWRAFAPFDTSSASSVTAVQVITVEDTEGPVFDMPLPMANITVECDAVPMAEMLTASDVCSGLAPIRPLWINEIHYDRPNDDIDEFIEVAGEAGTSLDGCELVLYNGGNRLAYDTIPLTGSIDDEGSGFGAVSFPLAPNTLQNGLAEGIALVCEGMVIEFLSYEGTLTAMDGPAAGLMSSL